MKAIQISLFLFLSASCGQISAQTNSPVKKQPEQELFITSSSAYYDGITNQMVYIGNVYVTDKVKAWLNCERLTVDVPQNGQNPTNIVAESNVVVNVFYKGQTNHITADKATYAYHVVNTVTNETITFAGGNPTMTNLDSVVSSDPIVIYLASHNIEKVDFQGPFKMNLKTSNKGTNASPFDFPK